MAKNGEDKEWRERGRLENSSPKRNDVEATNHMLVLTWYAKYSQTVCCLLTGDDAI